MHSAAYKLQRETLQKASGAFSPSQRCERHYEQEHAQNRVRQVMPLDHVTRHIDVRARIVPSCSRILSFFVFLSEATANRHLLRIKTKLYSLFRTVSLCPSSYATFQRSSNTSFSKLHNKYATQYQVFHFQVKRKQNCTRESIPPT